MPRKGDVVFNKMKIRSGAMGVAHEDGLVTYHYEVLRPREGMNPRYIVHLMKSSWFTSELIARERGISAGGEHGGIRTTEVPFTVLRTIDVLLPEIHEQRAIADYLDRETARIDTLIEEQQQLVKMLHMRRRAVVDAALSQGLDSEAGLSETGNPWIPELPCGWKAVRAKRVLVFGPANGVSPLAGDSDDLKSLSLGAIRDGRVSMAPEVTKFVDRSSLASTEALRLHPGDILLVRGNGNVDLVARAGLVGPEFAAEEYIYPDLLIRIRVSSSMLSEFFVWACNASATRAQVQAQARTAVGTFKVSGGDVRSLVLPLPPMHEQRAIVAHLDEQTSKIDSLITESERFIDLARERRSALITATVTGQIDVRELV
ncbi:restriction endonuclease subunit S domain-containing protein [Micromonospora narathiwatensis]|uniref:Type I restriction enzyme, S subunit n=1 Tax=Micromonospora narathiwatensis TaxID=299146 RepID=A0A1A9ADP9_9ACTN|nr:restriction endonuclease subunit S [Micromonospora narathiwatensis]SBT54322.1 type I restriction enzyme, S subunit [Micromonospora narathiwatensis]